MLTPDQIKEVQGMPISTEKAEAFMNAAGRMPTYREAQMMYAGMPLVSAYYDIQGVLSPTQVFSPLK